MKVEKLQSEDIQELYLEKVRKMLREIEYGQISIVIQDSKIVQIEQTQKIRLKS